jgi:hypothetical protein
MIVKALHTIVKLLHMIVKALHGMIQVVNGDYLKKVMGIVLEGV